MFCFPFLVCTDLGGNRRGRCERTKPGVNIFLFFNGNPTSWRLLMQRRCDRTFFAHD
ncbi:MAG: hypothetical protein AB4426_26230 [Xenococcaceae cyanobacterium]